MGYFYLDNGQLFKIIDQGVSWDLQGGNYGDVMDLNFIFLDWVFLICVYLVFIGNFGFEGIILSIVDQGVSWEVLFILGIFLFDVDF